MPTADMRPSNSTEHLLNSFPMFGHPGISALEYAGSLEAARKRNTSETLEFLNRKSTVFPQDENFAPPTTAGRDPTGPTVSPPLQYIDELGCQQRRKGTFLNHTPREFEMRSPKNVEVYRPSRSSSSENYSRPRSSYHATSIDGHTRASQYVYCSPSAFQVEGDKATFDHPHPVELDFTEMITSTTPDSYSPSTNEHYRSSSAPLARIVTYQPSCMAPSQQQKHEMSIQTTSNPITYPQEKKRQRRQTPFKISNLKPINVLRHAPLEPWVAEHRRKMSNENTIDLLPPVEISEDEEMGTFGVIQRYFDSQTGGPVSSPKLSYNPCSPYPSYILPDPPNPVLQSPFRAPAGICSIDELDFSHIPPPAVPDRSPRRLTSPCFPMQVHVESTVSVDSEFAFAAEGQYSPYDQDNCVAQSPRKQTPKRVNVGQADLAGSATVGKQAPPILDHDALTAKFHRGCNDKNYHHMGLNDLHHYLRNTGPSPEPQPAARQRKKPGIRLFKVKQRKSLATRVGSVEGSPQRQRKQTPIPACAREMTTAGGAKHLRIVIPTEAMLSKQSLVLPIPQSKTEHRSEHTSDVDDFTEEMLNPLASSDVEKMLSDFETPKHSMTPDSKSPRCPKKSPQSPKLVPVKNHPLISREEQTRARKLRDLQRIKRSTLATREQTEQHPDVVAGAPLTPAQTPEPVHNSSIDSGHEDEESTGTDDPDCKIKQIQQRVVSLQRQNTELTEALAKIVGLELEEGDLKPEDVLKAFNKIRFFRTPGVE